MYKELVKSLKGCVCIPCEREKNTNCFARNEEDCRRELMAQAANAIEELSKLADAIPHVCECCIGCELEKKNGGCDHAFVLSPKRAMQYLIKPRWIPVTEALPESGGSYIVYLRPFKGKTDLGYVIGDLSYPTEMYFDKGQMLWVCENESYNAILSAVDTENEYHVTHWMPLPEPPKEET